MNTVVLAAIGALIVAASLLMLDPMARMLGATESTFGYVTDYLRIIICFAPCFIISYSLEVLIKTDGFPQLATVGIIASALLNCVLDYLFVLVFHWGVTGAAVATGLAQLFLVLLFLHHFLKRKGMLKFQRFPWTFGIYRKILSIGMADCVTEMSIGIVVFLFNRTILSHIGEAAIVSYTVISYVNNLVLMTTTGIAQGMQPLSSFYYGKRDSASCHRLLRYGLVCVTAASSSSLLCACRLYSAGSSLRKVRSPVPPNMVKVSCFMPTASIHGESCLPHPHAQRYAHQNNHAVPESDWLRHALHKTGPDS